MFSCESSVFFRCAEVILFSSVTPSPRRSAAGLPIQPVWMEGPAQAAVVHDLLRSQDVRGNAIAAQCAHVGATAMSVRNRQHPGAQYVHHGGCVRTGVAQRTALEPRLEQGPWLAGIQPRRPVGPALWRCPDRPSAPRTRPGCLHPHGFIRRLGHPACRLLAGRRPAGSRNRPSPGPSLICVHPSGVFLMSGPKPCQIYLYAELARVH